MFAWAASRFFVEARRTGELELLLTTPLGAKQIVSTQWEVLKRGLRWPLVVMVAPDILQAGIVMVQMGGAAGAVRFVWAAIRAFCDCSAA